jgi:serine/threonine protein kinase
LQVEKNQLNRDSIDSTLDFSRCSENPIKESDSCASPGARPEQPPFAFYLLASPAAFCLPLPPFAFLLFTFYFLLLPSRRASCSLAFMGITSDIDSMIGKELAGRFQLIEKIGQGGMGAVFKAIHTQMGRACAIKLLLPISSDNDSTVERFKREAQMASRIDNPHAVTIYDFGEAETGMLYLAMEYIEGKPLGHLLNQERPLSSERIVHITSQIAAALSAAHKLGIVHRDLKPDNIMITRKGEDADYVKVLDFGIAKPVDEDDRENLTKTGFVLGTPFYMSPEQLSGEKLDGRSDVYSLALLVYEMFSGRLPFEGDNSQAIMVKRLIAEPKALREFVPTMNLEVERAVMSGLERERDKRAVSVEVFVAQLKSAIASTQVLSSRETHPVADEATPRSTLIIAEHPTSSEKSTDFIGSIDASSQALPGGDLNTGAATIGIEQPGDEIRSRGFVTHQDAARVVNPQEAQPQSPEAQHPPSAYITKESKDAKTPSANQAGQGDATATLPFASERANPQFPSMPSQQPAFPHQAPQANYQTPPPVYQTPAPTPFPPPQAVYQTPVVEQTKGSNNALIIGSVAIILLIVIGGGSYFIYTNYFSSSPISTTSSSNPPVKPNNDLPNLTKDNPTGTTTPPTRSENEEANIYFEKGKKHQEQAYAFMMADSQSQADAENKSAIAEYQKAIARQPLFPQAHENLGVALYGIGNLNAAIAEYQTAIDQYKQQGKLPTAQVLTNYGLALFDLKRYKEAADYFQRAYETDPSDTDLLAHRGFALHNAGQVDTAKALYNQYLKVAPKGQYAEGVKAILAGSAQPPATSGN